MAARPPAKKKPIKVPPVPPHKRQVDQYSEATATTGILEPEGEYESIDAQFIQERISDTVHQNVRETTFSPAQKSTAQQVQHPPHINYSKVKPKHQREIEEVEVGEAAPSLQPAATSIIMGAGIDKQQELPVTTQPLQIPIRPLGFTRERQRPAKVYKSMVVTLFYGCILCLPFCPASACISCICLAVANVTSNMTSKHNKAGDFVSAQACSVWTIVCSVVSIITFCAIPATSVIIIVSVIVNLAQ